MSRSSCSASRRIFQSLEIDAPLDGVAHDLAQRVGMDGVYLEVPLSDPMHVQEATFRFRAMDGELPVQRLKAGLKEVELS